MGFGHFTRVFTYKMAFNVFFYFIRFNFSFNDFLHFTRVFTHKMALGYKFFKRLLFMFSSFSTCFYV